MKGTMPSYKYIFEFIDNEGKEKESKVSASSMYKAKIIFNSRYKGKIKEFITCYEENQR